MFKSWSPFIYLWGRWIKSVYALWRYRYCCKFSNRWCWRLAPGWWNWRVAMAVVEVEGVIPTLAMDVEHTVIVLWLEVEVILLLVPAFWSLWRANTVAIIAKTGAQEDTKLAINTTRATNTEIVGIDAWMTSLQDHGLESHSAVVHWAGRRWKDVMGFKALPRNVALMWLADLQREAVFEATCWFIAASSCFVIYIDFAGERKSSRWLSLHANFSCKISRSRQSHPHASHLNMPCFPFAAYQPFQSCHSGGAARCKKPGSNLNRAVNSSRFLWQYSSWCYLAWFMQLLVWGDIATYLDTKSSSLVTRDAVFDATCWFTTSGIAYEKSSCNCCATAPSCRFFKKTLRLQI